MLRTFCIVYVRNLLRNRVLSIVSIGGLSLALTCFSVIALYVEHELSFDRFHHQPENVYRIAKDFVAADGTRLPDATTPPALTPAVRADLPEVEHVTRFFPNWGRLYLLQHSDKRFYETRLIRIDEHFFNVFEFAFLHGNKNEPFQGPNSILLTESTAKKYFGEENALGKVIRINLNNGTDYVVTGVLKDVPQNSHFTFDLLIPFQSGRNPDTNWDWHAFYTYVRLKPETHAQNFESKINELLKKYQPASLNEFYIQPITDIHLQSKLKWELATNNDITYVRILAAIAIFIVIIACINYVNLITAQASKRAKEVGIRKVTGAARHAFFKQFVMEAVFTCILAAGLSFILTSLLLPVGRDIFGYDLSDFLADSVYVKIILPVSVLVIGVLAGLYPAYYLASFEPLKVLRGSFLHSGRGIRLRQSLVVFQFVISTGLIIGALTISAQLNYMQQKKMGFNQDHIMLLPNVRGGIGNPVRVPGDKIEGMKKVPGVERIARADGIFGATNSTNGVSSKNGHHISLNFIRADYDFLPVLEIDVIEGRNFSDEFPSDSSAIILNQKAVEELGLSKPYIGQQLAWDDGVGITHQVTLIGIAKDFHFTSLREPIKPFGFILEVGNGSTFFLKLHAQNLSRTIAQIGEVWKKYSPDYPFEYSFQNSQMADEHLNEARFQKLFLWFTTLAIIIACFGLFGLITYQTESKTKEVGIRKVLGASIPAIIVLLSKELMLMVAVAMGIAFPLTWYLMKAWLESFAYHIDINWTLFALAAACSITLALITMCVQTLKAALSNPVNCLRNE